MYSMSWPRATVWMRGSPVESKMLEELADRRAALGAQLSAIQSQFENERALMKREKTAAKRQVQLLEAEISAYSTRLAIARKRHRDGQRLKASGALSKADLLQLADAVQSRSSML